MFAGPVDENRDLNNFLMGGKGRQPMEFFDDSWSQSKGDRSREVKKWLASAIFYSDQIFICNI